MVSLGMGEGFTCQNRFFSQHFRDVVLTCGHVEPWECWVNIWYIGLCVCAYIYIYTCVRVCTMCRRVLVLSRECHVQLSTPNKQSHCCCACWEPSEKSPQAAPQSSHLVTWGYGLGMSVFGSKSDWSLSWATEQLEKSNRWVDIFPSQGRLYT